MNALLTEGLLDLFDRILVRFRPDIDTAIEWLRDSATPPANLEFRASDGAVYTGLVVLERSRAILVLAVRSGQATAIPSPPHAAPLPNSSRYDPTRFESPRYDPQPAARPRDLFDDEPGDGWPPNDPFLPRR